MPRESSKQKRSPLADRPFPRRCRSCGEQKVEMGTTDYHIEVKHDGRLHPLHISKLELPICQACGEKVFTEKVDAQVTQALRTHLNLLTPDQIRAGIKRVGMTQKEFANSLGIAEATLSRWLNECQIQSQAMNNLLKAFLAFPQLRSALSAENHDPNLGLCDIPGDMIS
ncbi:MAG: hypothetical protein COA78_20800 [Blastopirellula sp.]|nr:MAG: hypothetical protein COA78_20800 [Blastopirellula sp.]